MPDPAPRPVSASLNWKELDLVLAELEPRRQPDPGNPPAHARRAGADPVPCRLTGPLTSAPQAHYLRAHLPLAALPAHPHPHPENGEPREAATVRLVPARAPEGREDRVGRAGGRGADRADRGARAGKSVSCGFACGAPRRTQWSPTRQARSWTAFYRRPAKGEVSGRLFDPAAAAAAASAAAPEGLRGARAARRGQLQREDRAAVHGAGAERGQGASRSPGRGEPRDAGEQGARHPQEPGGAAGRVRQPRAPAGAGRPSHEQPAPDRPGRPVARGGGLLPRWCTPGDRAGSRGQPRAERRRSTTSAPTRRKRDGARSSRRSPTCARCSPGSRRSGRALAGPARHGVARRAGPKAAQPRHPPVPADMPGLVFWSGRFKCIVGRTGAENDELLRRRSVRGNDWWFHARDWPGAYVFVKAAARARACPWRPCSTRGTSPSISARESHPAGRRVLHAGEIPAAGKGSAAGERSCRRRRRTCPSGWNPTGSNG